MWDRLYRTSRGIEEPDARRARASARVEASAHAVGDRVPLAARTRRQKIDVPDPVRAFCLRCRLRGARR